MLNKLLMSATVLYLAVGTFLWQTTDTRPVAWVVRQVAAALACVAIAKQLTPLAQQSFDDSFPPMIWTPLCGIHLFTNLSPISSMVMMRPALHQQQKKKDWDSKSTKASEFFLFLMVVVQVCGSSAEILGHYLDGWLYTTSSLSCTGWPNMVFSICLCAGLSALAAAITPKEPNKVLFAFFPTVVLALLPFTFGWTSATKPLVFSMQGMASAFSAYQWGLEFRSYWPWLYVVQVVNIVRSASRITTTGIQAYHLFVSVYGWFSFTFPFMLSVHPRTKSSSLVLVLACCAASIFVGDQLETWVGGTEWALATRVPLA